jgi:hypothetical protein
MLSVTSRHGSPDLIRKLFDRFTCQAPILLGNLIRVRRFAAFCPSKQIENENARHLDGEG